MKWYGPDTFGVVWAIKTTPVAKRIIEIFKPDPDYAFAHPIYFTLYVDGDRAELCETLDQAKETAEAYIRGEIGTAKAKAVVDDLAADAG